jgi:hypothetical protein
MHPSSLTEYIPQNYYCVWGFKIDHALNYNISIVRDDTGNDSISIETGVYYANNDSYLL